MPEDPRTLTIAPESRRVEFLMAGSKISRQLCLDALIPNFDDDYDESLRLLFGW